MSEDERFCEGCGKGLKEHEDDFYRGYCSGRCYGTTVGVYF